LSFQIKITGLRISEDANITEKFRSNISTSMLGE